MLAKSDFNDSERVMGLESAFYLALF